jgi:transcriptional regulator with XRE-family HTH domain
MSSVSKKIKTLGDFLKSRRERLQPADVGLIGSHGRRRTSGLRREEVAYLAGVSTTWYTWLEQGRDVTASREVLESIARALQLSPEEQLHLLSLANYGKPANTFMDEDTVDPELQKIIDQLTYPAFIANSRTEVLAWNQMASEFILYNSHMSEAVPPGRIVMTRYVFTSPYLRKYLENWDEFARYGIAVFRLYVDQNTDDPWFEQFVQQMCRESKEFAALWQLHDVQQKKVQLLTLNHPQAGRLSFQLNSFSHINGNANLHCCVFTPLATTETEQRLTKHLLSQR